MAYTILLIPDKDLSRGSQAEQETVQSKANTDQDLFTREQEVNNLHHRAMDLLLAAEGLTPPQFVALIRLREIDRPCKMSELSRATFMSPAVMTGLMGRLIKRGLVKRNFDERDRRLVLITITARGRAAISHIDERLRHLSRRFSELISESDKVVALRVLDKYVEFLGEELKLLKGK